MKKLIAFIVSVILFAAFLIGFNVLFSDKIEKNYYDKIGDIRNVEKYKSVILQEEAIKRNDNLFIFGSSELNLNKNPFHPSRFFENKRDGFQVNTIGAAGYKTLGHAADIGSLGDEFKNQKVVIVLSPQWFKPGGIQKNTFLANSSEQMVYKFLLNEKINYNLKKRFAKRVCEIIKEPDNNKLVFNKNGGIKAVLRYGYDILKVALIPKIDEVENKLKKGLKTEDANLAEKENNTASETIAKPMRYCCGLYSNDGILNRIQKNIMKPYFWFTSTTLYFKDEFNSLKIIYEQDLISIRNNKPKEPNYIKPKHVKINYKKAMVEANNYSKKVSSNNPFGFDNSIFNKKYKYNLDTLRGSWKTSTYTVSPEFEDFRILLEVCKQFNIKPLFINVPVNGMWYNFAEFSAEDRAKYYKIVKKMVADYKFEMADFSGYENEKFFLHDATHLGYKGWVYVNKELDRYYNDNKNESRR